MVSPVGSSTGGGSFLDISRVSEEGAAEDRTNAMNEQFASVSSQIERAIDRSQSDRASALERLPMVEEFSALTQKIGELQPLFLQYSALRRAAHKEADHSFSDEEQQVHQEERLEALEEDIDALQGDIQSQIAEVVRQHEDLQVTKECFSDFWSLHERDECKVDLSVNFIKEQILNRCCNKLSFIVQAEKFISDKKREIFDSFYNKDGKIESSSIDLSKLHFRVKPVASESHNRGKTALHVFFSLDGEEIFQVFYKPRSAEIDRLIIKVFNDLNQLPEGEKSLHASLPVYLITNEKLHHEDVSLWEYIDGVHQNGDTASEIIEALRIDLQKKDRLKQQLLRLESVCSRLDVSDLHRENLIFRGLQGESPEIVPIDLESIQVGSMTGLYPEPVEFPQFLQAELDLLNPCKERIMQQPFRFVPLPTSHFCGGLTRCDSFVDFGRLITQAIREKGFYLSCNENEIADLVLTDFINDDTPYLTEYLHKIYYGPHTDGREIASKEGCDG